MTLAYVDRHYVRDAVNSVSTNSLILVDDTAAVLNFTIDEPLLAFCMYCCYNRHGSTEGGDGKEAAINVDGVDEAIGYQSPWGADYKNSCTVVLVKQLAAGAHTIKGRFCSNSVLQTVTIDERQLVVILFRGTNYYFIRSTTPVTTNSAIFVDDPQAIQNFNLPSEMLALIIYNAGNETGDTVDSLGVRYGINVDGLDVATQEQRPAVANKKNGGTVVHMEILSAGAHTVSGRFSANRVATVTIRERQLAILLFPPDQLYDFVRSTVQVSTTQTCPTLADDTQAIVNRTLTDTRQVLIIYNPTNYNGTSCNWRGRTVGINVDGSDVSLNGQSPPGDNEKQAATVIDSRELAAGAHTIKGRFCRNGGTLTETMDERQLAILYFRRVVGPHKQNVLQKMMHGGI